jgi:hypothetical protein
MQACQDTGEFAAAFRKGMTSMLDLFLNGLLTRPV